MCAINSICLITAGKSTTLCWTWQHSINIIVQLCDLTIKKQQVLYSKHGVQKTWKACLDIVGPEENRGMFLVLSAMDTHWSRMTTLEGWMNEHVMQSLHTLLCVTFVCVSHFCVCVFVCGWCGTCVCLCLCACPSLKWMSSKNKGSQSLLLFTKTLRRAQTHIHTHTHAHTQTHTHTIMHN